MSELSFAQTYILASKVRSKLTKEAASPKASLRHLVVQANMLDNIMDYISEETERRTIQQREKSKLQQQQKAAPQVQAHVTFNIPVKPVNHTNTSVTEYELGDSDPESDSEDEDVEQFSPLIFRPANSIVEEDDDDDFTSSDSESDSDDYYYYSDSDEVEEDEEEQQQAQSPDNLPVFRELPVMNLSAIEEEDEDEDSYSSDSESEDSILSLPDLSDSYSLTDDEIEVHDIHEKPYAIAKSTPKSKYIEVEHKQQPFNNMFNGGTIALEHVF
ncbi:uncharacterized protein SPAPADRAFT_63675 [Spathaspora passalidarum NRRL Y-27907]|uniref:Uncharacterized protein n=1 Tax=Spathaspora passalidarum (strain NRRL Y-27907 / 11-Y1) TaxID=619300 RepID=G3AUW7_SPAPN|nr:uncharacterized protein SPAPADRAFT_63675 [Spathaspora passalidarum NRRL Y-27907]EGW30058.1 hypothetical protein SPAPADRAFT_63675 [Spathaspora passalidarum NRRL Y-27907]